MGAPYGFETAMAVWTQAQQDRQMAESARLAFEQHDYAMASDVARRAMSGGGTVHVAKHSGRWYAVVDGESDLPKIKKRNSA